MSIDTEFIARLRAEVARHREHSLDTIIGGTLTEKQYGYACGYLKALDDVIRQRGKLPTETPGMIDQIIEDMRKE